MTFRGWKAEALEFFDGLEADNSKAYWQAHKQEYVELVRAPMEELLAELEPDWGEGTIFRPYRDIRFSRDKSPYKTNIAATVGDGYVHLSARGLGAGSGMWEMAPDQLERYREAVAADRSGRELTRRVAKARGSGVDVTGHGELKTAPQGLLEGPSPDRVPPVQGAHHVAGVARRAVARHEAGEGPAGRVPRDIQADRGVASE